MCTCVLHVCGGVSVRHGIHVHKLLLEHGQQEGEAVVQADVEDELMGSKHGGEELDLKCTSA